MLNRRGDDPINKGDHTGVAERIKRIAVLLLRHMKGVPRISSPSAQRLRDGLDTCINKLKAIQSADALRDLELQIKTMIRMQSEEEQIRHAEQYASFQRLLDSVSANLTQLDDGSGDFAAKFNQHFQTMLDLALLGDPLEIGARLKLEISELRHLVEQKLGEDRQVTHHLQKHVAALEEQLVNANRELVYDALTRTYNRRAFDNRLDEAIKQHTGDGGQFALLLCDIDHFKLVNDKHGHLIGDRVLRAVCEVAKSCFRGEDFVARYGGEEFGILLEGASSLYATRSAERFRLAVTAKEYQYLRKNNQCSVRVTVSIGVAGFRPSDTPETLLRRADQALYLAKNRGRNRVVTDNEIESSGSANQSTTQAEAMEAQR